MNLNELFDEAVRIEEEGHKFYISLMEKARNAAARKMFRALADDELKHREIFLKMKESLEEGRTYEIKGFEFRKPPVFSDLKEDLLERLHRHSLYHGDSDPTVLDALSTAESAEKKSIAYYTKLLENEIDPTVRSAIKMIIGEEIIHLWLVRAQRKYLKEMGFWFDPDDFMAFREKIEADVRTAMEWEIPDLDALLE